MEKPCYLLLNSTLTVGDSSENHNIFVLPPAAQMLNLSTTGMLQGIYAVVLSAVEVSPTACSFTIKLLGVIDLRNPKCIKRIKQNQL